MDGVESESSPLRVRVAPPHRSFSAGDKRDPAISGVACVGGVYAVVDPGNAWVKVIGDAFIAFGVVFPVIGEADNQSRNYTCWFYCLVNETNELECCAG